MIYTLVPLGNPGNDYVRTRHNAARIVLSHITDEVEAISHLEVFVPETYMNESGRAVAEYLRYHEGRELVVMYDDKDLPLGSLRISHDRGDGGHNGVKSIIEALGTREFTRIRIGIAPIAVDGETAVAPHGDMVQGFVMGKATEDEMTAYKAVSSKVLRALRDICEHGYQKAMERNN